MKAKYSFVAALLLIVACDPLGDSQDPESSPSIAAVSSSSLQQISSSSHFEMDRGNSQGAESSSSIIAVSSSSLRQISSSSNFEKGYPQMDERVVAYIVGGYEEPIVSDMNKLKEEFKVALNEENFDSECDYFAISVFMGEGLSYMTVSKYQSEKINLNDDVLAVYNIHPSLEQPNAPGWINDDACMYPQNIVGHTLLICDKKGGLKDRMNFPPIIKYNDPNWDCWKGGEEAVPFFEFKK